MRKIKSIIIHMTETPPSMDIGVATVREWHLERGFSDVGYHFIIKKDGCIERGRPIEVTGAHCAGKNRDSIGIAYVGGWQGKDDRTKEQIESMDTLIDSITKVFGNLEIYGHYVFNNKKTCPNFNPTEEYWWAAKNTL